MDFSSLVNMHNASGGKDWALKDTFNKKDAADRLAVRLTQSIGRQGVFEVRGDEGHGYRICVKHGAFQATVDTLEKQRHFEAVATNLKDQTMKSGKTAPQAKAMMTTSSHPNAMLDEVSKTLDHLETTMRRTPNPFGHRTADNELVKGKDVIRSLDHQLNRTRTLIQALRETPDSKSVLKLRKQIDHALTQLEAVVARVKSQPDLRPEYGIAVARWAQAIPSYRLQNQYSQGARDVLLKAYAEYEALDAASTSALKVSGNIKPMSILLSQFGAFAPIEMRTHVRGELARLESDPSLQNNPPKNMVLEGHIIMDALEKFPMPFGTSNQAVAYLMNLSDIMHKIYKTFPKGSEMANSAAQLNRRITKQGTECLAGMNRDLEQINQKKIKNSEDLAIVSDYLTQLKTMANNAEIRKSKALCEAILKPIPDIVVVSPPLEPEAIDATPSAFGISGSDITVTELSLLSCVGEDAKRQRVKLQKLLDEHPNVEHLVVGNDKFPISEIRLLLRDDPEVLPAGLMEDIRVDCRDRQKRTLNRARFLAMTSIYRGLALDDNSTFPMLVPGETLDRIWKASRDPEELNSLNVRELLEVLRAADYVGLPTEHPIFLKVPQDDDPRLEAESPPLVVDPALKKARVTAQNGLVNRKI